MRTELGSFLQISIDGLPSSWKEVIRLRLMEWSDQSIASELGISRANVRKRAQLARAALRLKLKSYREGSASVRAGALQDVDLEPEPRRGAAPLAREGATLPPTRAVRWVEVEPESDSGYDPLLLVLHPVPTPTAKQLAALKLYVQKHPRGWKRRWSLARSHHQAGRLHEALGHYGFVNSKQPKQIEPWLERSSILATVNRADEAALVCDEASSWFENEPVSRYLEGLSHMYRGALDTACESLAVASQDLEETSILLVDLAGIHEQSGRLGRSLELYEAALARNPHDPAALYLGQHPLRMAGRLALAEQRLRRACEANGDHLPAECLQIVDRCYAGKTDGGEGASAQQRLRSFERSTAPRSGKVRVRAHWLLARGRTAESTRLFETFLEEHPAHAEAWLDLARVCARIGRYSKAAQALDQACALSPQIWRRDPDLLRVYNRASSPDVAQRHLRERVADPVADPMALWAYARASAEIGGCSDADLDMACASVELEPGFPLYRFDLGRLWLRRGEAEVAHRALTRGWELLPADDGYLQSTPAALVLAECCQRMGQHDRARTWLDTAREHALRAKHWDRFQAERWISEAHAACRRWGTTGLDEA